MSKYSVELKKKVVEAYANGEGGYQALAKAYGVASDEVVRRWIKAYQVMGDEAIDRRKHKKYSFEFKLNVVNLYLTTDVSKFELACTCGLSSPALISYWVRAFKIAGPDGLKPKPRKKKLKMITPKDKKAIRDEYVKQLEEENLKLRIENAYLKERRRLRLEEMPQKKRQK